MNNLLPFQFFILIFPLIDERRRKLEFTLLLPGPRNTLLLPAQVQMYQPARTGSDTGI